MVKKRLANGNPCDKCAQTEEMLRRRGLWERIDDVVWVIEGDDQSEGAKLGKIHDVKVAPFFILAHEDGSETVYTSPLRLIRDHLSVPGPEPEEPSVRLASEASPSLDADELAGVNQRFQQADPADLVRYVLERFGERCAIALTGAEDVVLLDMASKTGLAYRAFFVDSGRLHAETYSLLDQLRQHYGIEIGCTLPDPEKLMPLLNEKGQSSFLRDGHFECCAIRRAEPLARALRDCDAWMGLHSIGRELSTDPDPPRVAFDPLHRSESGPLIQFSPLAGWNSNKIWSYVRKHGVPHNELFAAGYRQIGCQPCTRPIRPDQDDREGLWWWEEGLETAAKLRPKGDGI
jgi:phosphoadenosine phosphosulfate reductase